MSRATILQGDFHNVNVNVYIYSKHNLAFRIVLHLFEGLPGEYFRNAMHWTVNLFGEGRIVECLLVAIYLLFAFHFRCFFECLFSSL